MYPLTVDGIQRRFRDAGMNVPDADSCEKLIELTAEFEQLHAKKIDVVGVVMRQIKKSVAGSRAKSRQNQRKRNKKPAD